MKRNIYNDDTDSMKSKYRVPNVLVLHVHQKI